MAGMSLDHISSLQNLKCRRTYLTPTDQPTTNGFSRRERIQALCILLSKANRAGILQSQQHMVLQSYNAGQSYVAQDWTRTGQYTFTDHDLARQMQIEEDQELAREFERSINGGNRNQNRHRSGSSRRSEVNEYEVPHLPNSGTASTRRGHRKGRNRSHHR